MGLFGFLKGKPEEPKQMPELTFPVYLSSPAKGNFVPMKDIPDEVFSTGVLGVCCGIDPEEGKVLSPIDGTITQLADTLHAIGIESGGLDLLIHVGVDTVEMNGDGFQASVKVGQQVKKGEELLTMDLAKIYGAGHPATVILAVTNSDDYAGVEETERASHPVQPGNSVLKISK